MIKKSILLIDNAEPLATCLADTLEMEGYEVVIANNRFTALALLEQKTPDLIITDLCIPGAETGFIRRLRERSTCHGVPIVAISADARSKSPQKKMAAEANFFTTIPFDVDLFLQLISSLTSKS